MSLPSELRHDFRHAAWMGISAGGNALLGFVAGVLLVRGLRQDEYGLVSSATAVMLVAQELVGKGINDSMVRLGTDAAAGSRDESVEVFRAGLVLKLLFLAPMVVVFAGASRWSARVFGYPELAEAFPAVLAAIAGYGIFTHAMAWYQARMQFGRLALCQPVGNLLKALLFLGGMAFAVLRWTTALWLMAVSLLISALLTGADGFRQMARRPRDAGRFRQAFTEVWKCSAWNILAAISFVTLGRMDIFTLSHHAAASEVGLYNAAWQVLFIVDLGTISIMTVMIPKVCHSVHLEALLSWAGRIARLGAAAAVLTLPLVLLADWYVPLLLGAGYGRSVPLIKIMYWGNVMALLVFPLVGILYARKAFHRNAAIQVLLLAASAPAYTWAEGRAGIVGAAWTTLALRLANCVLLLCAIGDELRKAPRKQEGEECPHIDPVP